MVSATLTYTMRADGDYGEASWPIDVEAAGADSRTLRYALAERVGLEPNSIRLAHVVIHHGVGCACTACGHCADCQDGTAGQVGTYCKVCHRSQRPDAA